MKWVFAFAALALLPSCSQKNDALAQKLATVRGFCDEWATRACNDKVVQACSATDANSCIESQQTYCESLIPDGTYSAKTAVNCLNAVAAAYNDAVLTADERDTVMHLGNECDKIISGPKTAGEACTADSDCDRDDDLACIKKTSPSGKCEAPSSPAIGGGHDCSAAEDVCEDGFYCDGTNCLAQKSTGSDCSVTVPCDSDSHCLDADGNLVGAAADGGAGSGTCQARKTNGGDCKTDDDCTSQICTPRSGSSSGVCSKQITLSPSDPICNALQ